MTALVRQIFHNFLLENVSNKQSTFEGLTDYSEGTIKTLDYFGALLVPFL